MSKVLSCQDSGSTFRGGGGRAGPGGRGRARVGEVGAGAHKAVAYGDVDCFPKYPIFALGIRNHLQTRGDRAASREAVLFRSLSVGSFIAHAVLRRARLRA